MNTETSSPKKTRRFRSLLLGATALTLVFGGAVIGDSLDLTRSTPAYADPVQVQGVEPFSFADVVEKVRPAVVSVRVRSSAQVASMDEEDMPFFDLPEGSPMERFFRQFRQQMPRGERPQRRSNTSVGSGFIISEDGYVVTNNHVTSEGDGDRHSRHGVEYDATVIGKDDKTDLASSRSRMRTANSPTSSFPMTEPRVGDWVVAVGNPFGLGGTVTAGIISAMAARSAPGPTTTSCRSTRRQPRQLGRPRLQLQRRGRRRQHRDLLAVGGNVGIAFAIPASTAETRHRRPQG
jgi:serine protease Do